MRALRLLAARVLFSLRAATRPRALCAQPRLPLRKTALPRTTLRWIAPLVIAPLATGCGDSGCADVESAIGAVCLPAALAPDRVAVLDVREACGNGCAAAPGCSAELIAGALYLTLREEVCGASSAACLEEPCKQGIALVHPARARTGRLSAAARRRRPGSAPGPRRRRVGLPPAGLPRQRRRQLEAASVTSPGRVGHAIYAAPCDRFALWCCGLQ